MTGRSSEALQPLPGVTGVVLAGGGSTRMGSDKAALPIAGEPLLRRVVRRLHAALTEVIVIGPRDLADLVPDVMVLADMRPGMGPLGGMETALRTVSAKYIFTVACDMPFLEPRLVRAMGELALRDSGVDAVVLRTERGTEQLHAVYARSCLPTIQRQLDANDLALRHLLSRLRTREFPQDEAAQYDPTGLSAYNANTPAEWAWALQFAEHADM